jgi:hypothetical protein
MATAIMLHPKASGELPDNLKVVRNVLQAIFAQIKKIEYTNQSVGI